MTGVNSQLIMIDCGPLINQERYPIEDIGSPARAMAVADVRTRLAADGCAVLKGFFSHKGLSLLRDEATERAGHAHFSSNKACNVYLGLGNPDREPEHPQNTFLERSNGFVPADLFEPDTVSRQLYAWGPLKDFIADCLGKDELYVYEDPVSNMIVNVVRPGQQFNWHFDTNEFTITMLLKAAGEGGIFEYVPNLRTPDDECYDDVRAVLDGDRQRVCELDLEEGDLQLFLGRFSLHRVTENTGTTERLLLIMSFAEEPGMVGNKVRVQDLYGRTTEVHEAIANRRDGLLD